MKLKPQRSFKALGFLLLSFVLVAGSRTDAGFQNNPPTAPKYVPPACQGKPLTVVPREVALAQTPTEVKSNPAIGKDEQLKLFDAAVKIINDVYVYQDFNGVNWSGVVAESRARVSAGLDTEAFYATMEALVSRLGDEHSHFDSPVKVQADKAALSGVNNYVGIGALMKPMIEKKRVSILAIIPDSPAEHGGLQQHDALLAVDGLAMVVDGKPYQQRTRGPQCSSAVITVQSPGTPPRDVTLVRNQVSGPTPIYARMVTTTDNSRIAYIFLPSFFDATIPDQVKKALVGLSPLDGLIIDNRMNTGGSSRVLLPTMSYFTSGTVGHLVSRAARRPLEITADPVGNSQKIPLVILVSHDTVSYGEIFSGVLKDVGRARIVGQTTAGRTETLHGYNFPDGSQAWIAQERFDPINSHADWKRQGIKPDVEAYADWDTFTFGSDPAVAKAVALLRK